MTPWQMANLYHFLIEWRLIFWLALLDCIFFLLICASIRANEREMKGGK